MVKKIVTVEVTCDSEEVWETTQQDISDIIDMLRNNSRDAKIIKIKECE